MADGSENRNSGYEMLIEVPNTNENDEKNYYEIYGNNKTNDATNNNHIFDQNNERSYQNFELGSPLNYTIGSPEEPFEKYCYNINEKKKVETDIKYYGHFLVSLICLGFFILYYIYYGDYSRILYGTNYNGKVCGKDLNSFKYLYYPLSPKTSKFEILKNYPKCLESCPTVENANDNKTDEENLDVEKKKKNFFEDNFFFPFKKNSGKNKGKIIDKSGNIETNVVYADYTKGPNNNLYVEYSLNSKYYDTVNIMNICYPRDKTLRDKVINIVFTNRYKIFVNLFSLHNSFFFVFLFIIVSIVLSILYIISLYYFPASTFYSFLIFYLISLFFIPIYLVHNHLYLVFDPIKGSFFSYHYIISILISFITIVHAVISLFIFYIYKNTYRYASKLIGITLKFMRDIPNIIYAPIIVSLASVLWSCVWIYFYVHIITSGNSYDQKLDLDLDTNGNSEIVSLQKVFYYFKSSYIFSMIWISIYFFVCEMLQSLNQFTMCHIGTMWYFSDKKKFEGNRNIVEEMKTILKYHFGSIVLSSFVNISTKHLRVLFFWINKTLSLPFFFNELIYNIKERFHFILHPMSKIVDMYTTSAYCEMSMTSHPYMISCHLSSKKLTNSTSPAAALHGISYITNIIFPGFSTMIITFFAFNIFNNFKMYNNIFSPSYIPNPFFSALIIGLICGIITSYFITIISTLADTFLYCFICECYQKQMIDENPLRKTYTPDLLREFILEIYEDYNSKL
ncbi:inner membrane complex suture component, putative [Plasmodium chabaudi chabaudi]|uniref:Choline transporter-like protein n=1 Tax=Plasmodium chabaudi chabaudi TaxID=31271 RepID=A0A1C6XEU4_PLACU|nr:inner membrane complex suture component, putative [Plasmodium chabaudi chabaudi]